MYLGLIAIKMHICMSSQQNDLVYPLWQEVPKLVYAFWTCKPVNMWVAVIPGTKYSQTMVRPGVGLQPPIRST